MLEPVELPRNLVLIAALMLAGCNSGDTSPLPGEQADLSQQFGQDEVRVAKALSIGSAQASLDDSGPYGQAMRCSVALDTVKEYLTKTGSQDLPQIELIRDVENFYDQRAVMLGADLGKSKSEVLTDKTGRIDEVGDLRDEAQIAIGCLREAS